MKNKSIGLKVRKIFEKYHMLKSAIYKAMFVVIALLVILLLTKLDTKPTNNLLNTIRTTINYEFHAKNDTISLYNKAKKVFNQTLENIPVFNTTEKLNPPVVGTVYRTFDHKVSTSNGKIKNGGVEIKLEGNMEPISIVDGLVTNIEKRDSKGYFITVEKDNMKIIYGYLESTNLKEGEVLKKGDVIGEVGLNRDGNRYLRIELYLDGELVDPEKYIDL